MKLGLFLSEYRTGSELAERFTSDNLGIIFVANGVYHAAVKEGGKASSLLDSKAKFYVLAEDLETRGFTAGQVDSRVQVITYDSLVDLMFNDYEKFVWAL